MDANSKFIQQDVGVNSAGSDSGICNDTELNRRLEANTLVLPALKPLVPGHQSLPYVVSGHNDFDLKTWMMKPFPWRQLNDEVRT